eukprot:g4964.t1
MHQNVKPPPPPLSTASPGTRVKLLAAISSAYGIKSGDSPLEQQENRQHNQQKMIKRKDELSSSLSCEITRAVKVVNDKACASAVRRILYRDGMKIPGAANAVSVLVEANENSETILETPLHVAARKGHISTLQALVAAGGTPNAPNSLGDNICHLLISGAMRASDRGESESVLSRYRTSLAWFTTLESSSCAFLKRNDKGKLPHSSLSHSHRRLYPRSVFLEMTKSDITTGVTLLSRLILRRNRLSLLKAVGIWRSQAARLTCKILLPAYQTEEKALSSLSRQLEGSHIARAKAKLEADAEADCIASTVVETMLRTVMTKSQNNVMMKERSVVQCRQKVEEVFKKTKEEASQNAENASLVSSLRSQRFRASSLHKMISVSAKNKKEEMQSALHDISNVMKTCTKLAEEHAHRRSRLLLKLAEAKEKLAEAEVDAKMARREFDAKREGILSVLNSIAQSSVEQASTLQLLEKQEKQLKDRAEEENIPLPTKREGVKEEAMQLFANACSVASQYYRAHFDALSHHTLSNENKDVEKRVLLEDFCNEKQYHAETKYERDVWRSMHQIALSSWNMEISRERKIMKIEKQKFESSIALAEKNFHQTEAMLRKEIADLQAQTKRKISSLKKALKQKDEQVQIMKCNLEKHAAALDETGKEISALRISRSHLECTEAARVELENQIRQNDRKHKKALDEQAVAHEEEKHELRTRHHEAMLNLADEHREEIAEMRRLCGEREDAISKGAELFQLEIARLKKQLAVKQQQMDGQKLSARRQRNIIENELEKVRSKAKETEQQLHERLEISKRDARHECARLQHLLDASKKQATVQVSQLNEEVESAKERIRQLELNHQADLAEFERQRNDQEAELLLQHQNDAEYWHTQHSEKEELLEVTRAKLATFESAQGALLLHVISERSKVGLLAKGFRKWAGNVMVSLFHDIQKRQNENLEKRSLQLQNAKIDKYKATVTELQKQLAITRAKAKKSFVELANAAETESQAHLAEAEMQRAAVAAFRRKFAIILLNQFTKRLRNARLSFAFRKWILIYLRDEIAKHRLQLDSESENHKALFDLTVQRTVEFEKIIKNKEAQHQAEIQVSREKMKCFESTMKQLDFDLVQNWKQRCREKAILLLGVVLQRRMKLQVAKFFRRLVTFYIVKKKPPCTHCDSQTTAHALQLTQRDERLEHLRKQLDAAKSSITELAEASKAESEAQQCEIETYKHMHFLSVVECILRTTIKAKLNSAFRQWIGLSYSKNIATLRTQFSVVTATSEHLEKQVCVQREELNLAKRQRVLTVTKILLKRTVQAKQSAAFYHWFRLYSTPPKSEKIVESYLEKKSLQQMVITIAVILISTIVYQLYSENLPHAH